MEVVKAIQRIGWRFGGNDNKRPFPVNKADIEAYNALNDYVEQTQKEQFQNNELFAKLYIYMFTKILENDKANVFENHTRKKLGNLLKKPVTQLIEELTQSLNESEIYGVLQDVGATHPAIRTEAQKKEQDDKLHELMEDPVNEARLLGEVWDYETVKKVMEREVNFIINLHR